MSFLKFAEAQILEKIKWEDEDAIKSVSDASTESSKKAISQFKKTVAKVKNNLALSRDFMYIRTRAIGSLESWGPNQNGDGFPLKELQASYKTFVGKGNFIDHKSDDIQMIRGLVVDAYMNNEDGCVECLIAVDRESHPQLCRDIETGVVNSVSMGTRVGWSVCSVCGNIARTENDYCDHIKGYKGMKVGLYTNNAEHKFGAWPIHEVNHELEFIELSWVSVPAFREANVLERIASLKNVIDKNKKIAKVILKRDGKEIKEFNDENDALLWIQRNTSLSSDYAFKYEGYSLDTVEDAPEYPSQILNSPMPDDLKSIKSNDNIPNALREIAENAKCKKTECATDIRANRNKSNSIKGENMQKKAAGMLRIKIDISQITFRKTWKDFKASGTVNINEKNYEWTAYSSDKNVWHLNLDDSASDQISANGIQSIENAVAELLTKNIDTTELIVSSDSNSIKTAYLNSQNPDPLMKEYINDRYKDEKEKDKPIYDNKDLQISGTKGKSSMELEEKAYRTTAKEGPSGELGKRLPEKDETLKDDEKKYKEQLSRAYAKYIMQKKGQ